MSMRFLKGLECAVSDELETGPRYRGPVAMSADKQVELLEAVSQLTRRELIAFNAMRTGEATSRRNALQIAGYSPHYCKQSGKVFGRPKMVLALGLAADVDTRNSRMDASALLDRLISLASADPQDAYDDNGAIKPMHEWPKALRLRVKSLDLNVLGGVDKVQFESHVGVLKLIGQHRMVSAFADDRSGGDRVYIVRDWTGQGLARGQHDDQEVIDVGLSPRKDPGTQGKTADGEAKGGTPGSSRPGVVAGGNLTSNTEPFPQDAPPPSPPSDSQKILTPDSPPLEISSTSVDTGTIPKKRTK